MLKKLKSCYYTHAKALFREEKKQSQKSQVCTMYMQKDIVTTTAAGTVLESLDEKRAEGFLE